MFNQNSCACLPWVSQLNKVLVVLVSYATPACRGTEAAPPESDAMRKKRRDFDRQGSAFLQLVVAAFPIF